MQMLGCFAAKQSGNLWCMTCNLPVVHDTPMLSVRPLHSSQEGVLWFVDASVHLIHCLIE